MLKSYRNKVKELQNKNQKLEKIIKIKLGLSEAESLPINWEEELVKRTEIEARYAEEMLAKEQEFQEKEELMKQLAMARAAQTIGTETHSIGSDVGDYEVEVQLQIKQLQEEVIRLEEEKRILERLLAEKEIERQEISNQLEEENGLESESQNKEEQKKKKARLEGELNAVKRDKDRLGKKLTEVQQKLQIKKKTLSLLQKSDSEESLEMKEKALKEKYPGLSKLLSEVKNKFKGDDYKWLIKIFESQAELINLENQDNPRPKAQEISQARWKLRNFQSKLKKERVGEFLVKSKEIIEKQVRSQKNSSSTQMKRQTSADASPIRRQSNPQKIKQQPQIQIPPKGNN